MDSEGKRAKKIFRYFIVERPTFVCFENQIYEFAKVKGIYTSVPILSFLTGYYTCTQVGGKK
jgi:hypothetical protein